MEPLVWMYVEGADWVGVSPTSDFTSFFQSSSPVAASRQKNLYSVWWPPTRTLVPSSENSTDSMDRSSRRLTQISLSWLMSMTLMRPSRAPTTTRVPSLEKRSTASVWEWADTLAWYSSTGNSSAYDISNSLYGTGFSGAYEGVDRTSALASLTSNLYFMCGTQSRSARIRVTSWPTDTFDISSPDAS